MLKTERAAHGSRRNAVRIQFQSLAANPRTGDRSGRRSRFSTVSLSVSAVRLCRRWSGHTCRLALVTASPPAPSSASCRSVPY